MKKYKTEFKLEVVQSFLAGEGGAKLLARRWSVPEEKVRTWVSHYRLHGIDGLRPKRSAYGAQFKLQVLAHQDREQLSSRQVAALYVRGERLVDLDALDVRVLPVGAFQGQFDRRHRADTEHVRFYRREVVRDQARPGLETASISATRCPSGDLMCAS